MAMSEPPASGAEGIPVANGGTPIPVEDYAYDEEGNRTASHLSALYVSNTHNQLTADSDYTNNWLKRHGFSPIWSEQREYFAAL